jgi:hypothetical protein
MPQLTPITKQTHINKSWTRFSTYTFAAKDNLASLVAAEIPKAISAMPMAFTRHQDRYILVAVLSLIPDINFFVAPDGRWLGKYIPSVFRSYPFCQARVEGQENHVLCVDEDSGLINDDKTAGEPFFDDNGELTQPVKDVMNFLNHVTQNRAVTETAVVSLAEAGLITEWPLKIKDEVQEKPVSGLYRVDETRLNALDDQTFLKIRKAGALPIAYAQLMSMGNMQNLAQMAKAWEQMNQSQMKAKESVIKPVFGDDDMISFD